MIDLGQDQQELIASKPADAIVRACVLSQRDADLPQRHVACKMATSIIDPLKAVAVEQGEREGPTETASAAQFRIECLDECLPVGKPGERVESSEPMGLREPLA